MMLWGPLVGLVVGALILGAGARQNHGPRRGGAKDGLEEGYGNYSASTQDEDDNDHSRGHGSFGRKRPWKGCGRGAEPPSFGSPALMQRVTGGYTGRRDDYPSFVSVRIFTTLGGDTRCGGALISDTTILTAAHCLDADDGVRAVYVWFSDKSPNDASLADGIKVSRWCASRRFHRLQDGYDVAVLHLSRPAPLSYRVNPICLPNRPIAANQQSWAIGKGLNKPRAFPDRLQVLPVVPVRCEKHVPLICFISNKPRYAGNVCSGDSGGPVVAMMNGRQTIVGVVSWGTVIGCPINYRSMSYYSDVYKLRQEIARLQSC